MVRDTGQSRWTGISVCSLWNSRLEARRCRNNRRLRTRWWRTRPAASCTHTDRQTYRSYFTLVAKQPDKWMNEWMSLRLPPLIETYCEGAVCPSYACLYSSVLSLLQKPVNVRFMPRTVKGNEFQIEVAKLRDPYRANRLRGSCQLT